MNQTAALYQLQQLDSQIDALAAQMAEIEAILASDEILRAAQETLKAAQQAHLHWRARQSDLELERQQLKEEADAIEERLYSGRVLNPRELTDLQDKLAELRQRHAAREEPLLAAMFQVDECSTAELEAASRLEQVKIERADEFGALTDKAVQIDQEKRALQARVEELRKQVTPAHLALYDGLRNRPGKLAVASIEGDECAVCGVEINSRLAQQVRRGEVRQCTTCERIMYHP